MTIFCFGHNIHPLASMCYLLSGHSYFMLLFPLQSLIPLVISVSQSGRGFTMLSFMYTFYFEERVVWVELCFSSTHWPQWCFTFALGQPVNRSFFQRKSLHLTLWISQVQSTFTQFFLECSLIGCWKMKHFAAMALLMRNRQYLNTFIAIPYICSSCRRFKVHKAGEGYSIFHCWMWPSRLLFLLFLAPHALSPYETKDSANCPHTPPL